MAYANIGPGQDLNHQDGETHSSSRNTIFTGPSSETGPGGGVGREGRQTRDPHVTTTLYMSHTRPGR